MSKKFLITGANRGLGFQKVKSVLKYYPDAIIYFTARSQQNFDDSILKLKNSNFITDNIHFL